MIAVARRVHFIGALMLCAGCGAGPQPFDQALDDAEDARRQKDFAQEREHFDRAEALATKEDEKAEARYRRAHTWLREGELERGATALEELATELPESYRAGRCWLDAGRSWERLGSRPRALAAYQKAVVNYPEFGGAISAAKRLVALQDEQGQAPHLSWRKLVRLNQSKELRAALLYQLAGSLEEISLAEAVKTYETLAREYPLPEGKYTDEGLLRAAELRHEAGDHEGALATLSVLTDRREKADIVGSYARPAYTKAFLLAGEIERDALGHPERARDTYRALPKKYPDSRLVDDALWQAALTSHLLGEDACSDLKQLRDRRPGSRFLRCEQHLCPGPPKSPSDECKKALNLPLGKEQSSEPSEESDENE